MITEKDILIKEPKEYIDKVALIAQISFIERSQQRYMSNKLKELNLFLGEVKLIMSICANEGLSQEDLVKTFGLNKSTVANSLRSLEEQGYIHGSGEDQDSHGLMDIISEDHIVIGICSGGSTGK